jgi:hypothetical protein
MKNKIMAIVLCSTLGVISLGKPSQAQYQPQRNIYTCLERNGKSTTVVDTRRGRIELIVWQSNFFQGSGWDPQSRCEEVSSRFQQFSDTGELRYVTTGKINGYNVICVADSERPQQNICQNNGLLITLEPNDNPEQVKNELFDVAARIRGQAITRGCPSEPNYYKKPILDLSKFLQCVPTVKAHIEAENIDTKDPSLSIPPNFTKTKTDSPEQPLSPPNPEPSKNVVETDSFWWQ